MSNSKVLYSNRKGFTLIELIVYIAISSILLTVLCSILIFTNKATSKGASLDDALFNGRFAMEYIKKEVTNSDRIICSSDFHNLDDVYPSNLGFVSMSEEIIYDKNNQNISKIRYNFRTYYFKDGRLVRLAYSNDEIVYNSYLLDGHNQLTDGVIDLTSSLDSLNNRINLSFYVDTSGQPLLLETVINLRCPIE